jgi:hypothetical protein
LAIGGLDHVPPPVVVLLEVLLEKDPARSGRTSEGDTDDNKRDRRTAWSHSSELPEDAP